MGLNKTLQIPTNQEQYKQSADHFVIKKTDKPMTHYQFSTFRGDSELQQPTNIEQKKKIIKNSRFPVG